MHSYIFLRRPLLCCALLLGALASTGCSAAGFELTVPLPESTVPGSAVSGLLDGLVDSPVPLNVDLAAETDARDTGPISAVRLVELGLFVTETEEPAGDQDDFGFVESATVFVEADGLQRAPIAEAVPPLEGDRVLVFVTEPDVNLQPYIEAGAALTIEASGSSPPDDVSFAGTATLSVELL